MIGVYLLAFVMVGAMSVYLGETSYILSAGYLGWLAVIVVLSGLLALLKRNSRIAKWLFGFWCLFLFFDGISSEPRLLSLVNYGMAVLAFVGLAGLWESRNEKVF